MTASATYDTLSPRVVSRPAWAASALVALALHGALVFAVAWSVAADAEDDDIGAPAIELAMDMAAPKAEPSDAPPGPESAASAAAPDSAQSERNIEAPDRPKVDPVESENSDRVVSPDAQKKTDREDEPKPQPSVASVASVASEETAAPSQESEVATRVATAPVIGPGHNARFVRATWEKRLVAHLDRHKRYPAGVRRDIEIPVRFTIDRAGHVVSAVVAHTSGVTEFDEAALAMMRRSDPVPPPPALLADSELTFVVPVVFRTRSR